MLLGKYQANYVIYGDPMKVTPQDGWECESNHCRSLAEEVARAPGILTREMVLLENFNFSGKVSGGYPRRDLELDVIPEQQLKGRRLT